MKKLLTSIGWVALGSFSLALTAFPVSANPLKGEVLKIDSYEGSNVAEQAEIDIQGTVKDASGQALLGVSILVKGTTKGTITDMDGHFTLNDISEDAVLQVSFIGFKSQEVAIGGKSQLEIVLEEDTQGLEEVVVTGYTTQKRENLTGSVAIVDGDKLQDITSPNVGNMLQGKLAGVDVSASSGAPGALPKIRIRGKNSIRSSVNPIWVVDGVI